tara:strand:- start:563 stop:889 length:327 start_codon:yes stop_codon:yes gene_type:complete
MALSIDGSRSEAQAIAQVCTELAAILAKADVILEHNSDQSIEWAAAQLPAYIAEDAQGNINGLLFDRASVSNAVGSLAQFRALMTNQAVAQGDHLGNINKLATAMPLR